MSAEPRTDRERKHTERERAERVEAVARDFHETYERLAPAYSYETRLGSRMAWEDMPDFPNKALMRAVVAEVLARLARPYTERQEPPK